MPGFETDPRTDPAMRAAMLADDRAMQAVLPDPPATPDARMRAARETVRAAMPPMHPEDLAVERIALDAPGRPDLPRPILHLFRPPGAHSSSPALLWLHGGGWCFGSATTHARPLRAIARQSGLCVLALDYRLAPEHPFPAALHDAEAALSRIAAQGGSWGIDPGQLLLGGDSAGGNLALSLALAHPGKLRGLALVYPVTDSDFSTPSYAEFAEGFSPTRAGMQAFWRLYADAAREDWRAAPLRAESFAELPPVHLQIAGLDVLRDDGLRLEARLRAEGVPVATQLWPGLLHAYLAHGGEVPQAAEAIAALAAWARARVAAA